MQFYSVIVIGKREHLSVIKIEIDEQLEEREVVALYQANRWTSAQKPKQLMAALANSHAVVTARIDGILVGLGNSLSDGHLVVYYPHLLVRPDFQRQGVGKAIMEKMCEKYINFHQQILVADGKAIDFYKSLGFERAGSSEPMWIYDGKEH